MTRDDAILAVLHRLEAENRTMKRIGGAALTVIAVVVLGAMVWQDSDKTVAVQQVLRTQKLELTNAKGEVVAVLQATNPDGVRTVVGYHPNGVPRHRLQFVDNQLHGRYETWDLSGFKTEETNYRDGMRHGPSTEWRSQSGGKTTVVRSGSYNEDRQVGPWVTYHVRTGRKRTDGSYDERGHRHGLWQAWHRNGQLESKGLYKDDLRDGPWSFWNDDGTVNEEKTGHYVAGERMR